MNVAESVDNKSDASNYVALCIFRAFCETTNPGDGRVFAPYIYELSNIADARVAKCFKSKNWQDVDLSMIATHHPTQLSFEGAIYFLPAVLMATLDKSAEGDDWNFLNEYIYDDFRGLTPEYNRNKINLKEHLTPAQKFAVVAYLKFRSGKDDAALPSLEGTWSDVDYSDNNSSTILG